MAERSISLRLAIANADQAIAKLKQFGTEGEAALNKLGTGAAPANRAMGLLGTAFDDLQGRVTASVGPLGGIAGRIAAFGPAAAVGVAGVGALVGGLVAGIREAQGAEQSFARLQGVVRATGGSAGLTASQIRDFAEELEGATLASAEGVQDAAAALATFRSVSGSTFTSALSVAQDLAAVFGGDLRSSAIQLGKALEDPEKGITALRRSGVSFSAAQRDVITNLAETGRVAEAQRLILEGVAQQVGGAGAAEADTLTGAFHRAADALGDFLRDVAQSSGIMGVLRQQVEFLARDINGLGEVLSGGGPSDRLAEIGREISDTEKASRLARIGGIGETQAGVAGGRGDALQARLEGLREEKRLLEENLRVERQQGEQAAVLGDLRQQDLQLEAVRDRIKKTEEDLGKAAQRNETEAQGIARVNTELTKKMVLLEQEKKNVTATGGTGADLAAIDRAAAQARANAQADIAALQKPRLEKAKAAEEAAAREAAAERKRFDEFRGDATAELTIRQQLAGEAKKGQAAYDALRITLDAENKVRDFGLDVKSKEGQALVQEIAGAARLDAETKKLLETEKARATERDKRIKFIGETKLEADQARALAAAAAISTKAHKDLTIVLDAENKVRSEGLQIGTAEGDARKQDIIDAERAKQSVEEIIDARKTAQEEEKRAAERQAEIVSDIFIQPFKDITSEVTNLTSDMILELTRGGEEGGKSFALKFQEAIQDIGANFVASLVSAPLNAATSQLGAMLTKAIAPTSEGGGGGGLGAQLGAGWQWINKSPLNAGIAGAGVGGLVGGAYGQLAGKPNSYATTGGSLGGAAGAAIGSLFGPIGTVAGGLLGSVGGSFIGGMFGGGDDNSGDNNAFKRWNPRMGFTRSDRPQEGGEGNTRIVDTILAEAMKAAQIIESIGGKALGERYFGLGVHAGSNSGIKINNKSYASIEEATKAAIEIVADDLFRLQGKGTRTAGLILSNTQAGTADELAADLQFGKEFDRLVSGLGDTGRALQDLEEKFDATKDKAEQFGLSVKKLEAVHDEAYHNIKEAAERTIRTLTGDFGTYDQALFELNTRYEEGKQVAKDLGISTEKLNRVRDQERELLRERFTNEIKVLTGELTPFQNEMLNLRDSFKAANENAKDLKISTKDLAAAQIKAEQELSETRLREAHQGVASAAEQLRSFFGGQIEPLRQATSSFYGLAGYVSPEESLKSGRREFRDVLDRSREGDLSAISALPQVGQQLLQLGRQNFASGPEFRELFLEVNKGITEVMTEAQRRQEEVMRGIPDAIFQSRDDMVAELKAGFDRAVAALKAVEKGITTSKPGAALAMVA